MRLALISCLALASTLAVSQPPAAAAPARASVTTLIMPSADAMVPRPFQPDTAAPPESTTFLQFVEICPSTGCGRPICNTDSIRVTVGGSFPSNCFFVRKVDLYYPPIVSIRPFAPYVRVLVDDGGCLGRPCISGRFPWSETITMPPLPQGPYTLSVAMIVVSCSDSFPPPPWDLKSFEFAVDCQLPPPSPCLLTSWEPHTPFDGDPCDVVITPTQPVQFTLKLGTRVPLNGLQGSFELRPPVLKITNIEAVGAAAGMRVAWTPSDVGANFVMFSTILGGIPPSPADGSHEPVLTLTISAPPGVTIPPTTELLLTNVLGSDPEGGAVPPCPIIARERLVYIPPPRICSTTDCDFNRDGFSDVRDLVLMVNCLHLRDACALFFDCNGDSAMTLDDVLCCAWKILRGRPCTNPTDCPGDTTRPRPDPRVQVTVKPPSIEGNEVRVAIHIEGADRVGGARLAMSFPTDRWRIAGFDSDDSGWLTLANEERGEAVMGAIRLSPLVGPTELNLTLRLQPLGGAPAGGMLGALQADVSAMDGVRLVVPIVAPARPLPGRTAELSENRPEPFSGTTQFTLSLPVAAVVDLGVYDLSGRRIATLHRGPLGAGASDFSWNGRSDGGDRARGGVYFYRAVVDGRAVSRRMVLLGGR
jgi:hypothetical protein